MLHVTTRMSLRNLRNRGLAIAFIATCLPYLALAPGSDATKNLWLVHSVAPWTFLTDPKAAGYVFRFFFEPLWPLLYYVDALLAPWTGNVAYHVVNVGAALAIGAILPRFLRPAQRPAASFAIFALLASPLVWFVVGMSTARNYLVATTFALLALHPYWAAAESGRTVTCAEAVRSAVFFALAIATKEAMATFPLIFFLLDLYRRRSLPGSILAVAPHAAALGLLVAWRWHILGGPGGYWMSPAVNADNLPLAFVMLGELQWGSWWPAVALVLAVATLRAGKPAAFLALAALIAAAPFVFAGDIGGAEFRPFAGARMLAPAAFFTLILARALASLGTRAMRASVAAAVVLVALQWGQRDLVARGLSIAIPLDEYAAGAARSAEPVALISAGSMEFAYAHQMRSEPKPPLFSYQTPQSYRLDLALGRRFPEGTKTLRIREDWRPPELVPLDLQGSRVWADRSGHFRARLAPEILQNLTLTWIHENGPTHWVVTLPVGRTEINLPLSYSVRAIVLAQISVDGNRWPVLVWKSPFFRPTYP